MPRTLIFGKRQCDNCCGTWIPGQNRISLTHHTLPIAEWDRGALSVSCDCTDMAVQRHHIWPLPAEDGLIRLNDAQSSAFMNQSIMPTNCAWYDNSNQSTVVRCICWRSEGRSVGSYITEVLASDCHTMSAFHQATHNLDHSVQADTWLPVR